jgi:hypothetical protein
VVLTWWRLTGTAIAAAMDGYQAAMTLVTDVVVIVTITLWP